MELIKIKNRVLEEIKLHFEEYRDFISEGDSLLDIGIGPGFATKYITSRFKSISVIGLDITDILQVNLPIVVYPGKQMPFVNKQFDISVIFYVLHHAESPNKLLKEAARVTKRNLIIIEEFNLPYVNKIEESRKEKQVLLSLGISENLHYHEISQKWLEKTLVKNNLAILKRKRLKTRSKRLVKKYLYVLKIRN